MFGLGWMTNHTDAREAVRAVAAGEAVLLDVRTSAEFDGAHAVGAINYELGRIAGGHLPPVGKHDTVYLYCQSGARSAQAAMLLQRAGFANVQNIGPLQSWVTAGGPVAESDGPSSPPECQIQL